MLQQSTFSLTAWLSPSHWLLLANFPIPVSLFINNPVSKQLFVHLFMSWGETRAFQSIIWLFYHEGQPTRYLNILWIVLISNCSGLCRYRGYAIVTCISSAWADQSTPRTAVSPSTINGTRANGRSNSVRPNWKTLGFTNVKLAPSPLEATSSISK